MHIVGGWVGNVFLVNNYMYFENWEGGTQTDAVKVLNLTDIWHIDGILKAQKGPLQNQILDVLKFENELAHWTPIDLRLRKIVLVVIIRTPNLMVPRTLENLENLEITWNLKYDLENLEHLEITW